MANNQNSGTSNITWNEYDENHERRIIERLSEEDIHRDSMELYRINENGTIADMIQVINANFREIAEHGGGPAGFDGLNGIDGVDGVNAEFIYALCDSITDEDEGTKYPVGNAAADLFNRVNQNGDMAKFGNVEWYNHPQGVSIDHKNEYVMARYRRSIEGEWFYSKPALWSHWGETGRDGDGVEYIFLRVNHELSESEKQMCLVSKSGLNQVAKVIYNMDDFFPGSLWFNTTNENAAWVAVQNAGISGVSQSSFRSRFENPSDRYGLCVSGYDWTDDPKGTTADLQYEYVAIRRCTTDASGKKEWSKYSVPALWATYSKTSRTFIVYKNTLERNEDENGIPRLDRPVGGHWNVDTDTFSPPTGWNDKDVENPNYPYTWISSGIFDKITGDLIGEWSDPICITGPTGEKGADGTDIEFIYALINAEVPSPDIHYPTNEAERETLFDDVENAEKVNGKKSKMYNSVEWCDNAQPISPEHHTEYMWVRERKEFDDEGKPVWIYADKPVIWAHWGEDGTDGDGVEYIFHLSKTETFASDSVPMKLSQMTGALGPYLKIVYNLNDFYPGNDWFSREIDGQLVNKNNAENAVREAAEHNTANGTNISVEYFNNHWDDIVSALDKGWTDNPSGTSAQNPYEFVAIRRCDPDAEVRTWGDYSNPAQWSYYGKATRTFLVYCNMVEGKKPKDPQGGFWNYHGDPELAMSSSDRTHEYKFNALETGTPDWNSHIGYWEDDNEDIDGTITWTATGTFTEDGACVYWSKPHRMTGRTGTAGDDGADIEFIYALEDDMKIGENYPHIVRKANESDTRYTQEDLFNDVELNKVKRYTDMEEYEGHTPTGETTDWLDNVPVMDRSHPTIYAWSRHKDSGLDMPWEYDEEPWIWSHWGEDGKDGNGVEYIFFTAKHNTIQSDEIPMKIEDMNKIQKAIYQIDDFYPGLEWFTKPETLNKHREEAENALKAIGEYDSAEAFNQKWEAYFGFFTNTDDCHNKTWTDNPTGTSPEVQYEFVAIRKSDPDAEKRNWSDFSHPVLWSCYGKSTRTFMVYCNMVLNEDESINNIPPADPTNGWWNTTGNYLQNGETDSNPYKKDILSDRTTLNSDERYTVTERANIGYWQDDDVDVHDTITWVASGTFDDTGSNVFWSAPHRITGAQGVKGADGSNIEFIYALTDNPQYPDNDADRNKLFYHVEHPEISDDDPNVIGTKYHNNDLNVDYIKYGDTDWYDRALMITKTDKTEYCVSRRLPAGSTTWIPDPAPFVWAHWGEDGTDGDGIEYIFLPSTSVISLSDLPVNTWNGYVSISNLINVYEKGIYQIGDLIPSSSWFDGSTGQMTNKEYYKEKVSKYVASETGSAFNETTYNTAWDSMKSKFSFDTLYSQNWYDNPQDLTPTNKFQYVSVRKSPDGVWGEFSYPTLWSKYNIAKFRSMAFTKVKIGVDISGMSPFGGTYDDPVPGDSTTHQQTYPTTNGTTYTWSDGPDICADNEEIWMTSATFSEETPNSPLSPGWTSPQKMTDSQEMNVEWSSTDLSVEEVSILNAMFKSRNAEFNYGLFLNAAHHQEAQAEQDWRTAVENATRTLVGLSTPVSFGDDSAYAYLMATCQYKGNTWTPWKVVRVKGEKGVPGTSIQVRDKIDHEVYFGTNTGTITASSTYNYSNASDALDAAKSNLEKTPVDGDILIVYPATPRQVTENNSIYWGEEEQGGALYIWKYSKPTESSEGTWVDMNNHDTPNSNGASEGYAYTSPNKHLILWDGDSWQDLGELTGPQGEKGENWAIHIRYANDYFGDDAPTCNKKFVTTTSDILSAKYIGFCAYKKTDAIDPDTAFDEDDYTWSLFKGQDGFGYEYIFYATATNEAPDVPTTTPEEDVTDDVKPMNTATSVRWSDDPIEPELPNKKYIWMCYRRYDRSEGKWEKFRGKNGAIAGSTGAKAKLWQVYARSISDVHEYFYSSDTISPDWSTVDPNTTDSSIDTNVWKERNQVTWNEEYKYLFNREVITYSDNLCTVLDPHFIAAFSDGVIDFIDYYILESVNGTNNDGETGEDAPGLDVNGNPITAPQSLDDNEGYDFWTTSGIIAKMTPEHPVLWNVTKKIYDDFIEGSNSIHRSDWTSPIVIGVYGQGKNGEDFIYVDLDNEMDSIQIDKNKKVVVGKTFTTKLQMYKGSEKMMIADVDVTGESGGGLDSAITVSKRYCVDSNYGDKFFIEATHSGQAGFIEEGQDNIFYPNGIAYEYGSLKLYGAKYVEITITVNANSTLTSAYTKIEFHSTAVEKASITGGDIIRSTSYTLVGTTYPVIYSIVPDKSELVRPAGGFSYSDTLPVSVVEMNGSSTDTHTDNSTVGGKFKLTAIITYKDGTNSGTTDLTQGSRVFAYPLGGLNIGDCINFIVAVDADNTGTSGNGYETVLDKETVYIIGDGAPGDPGDPGNGYQYCYARTVKGTSYTGALSVSGSDNPTIKYGTASLTTTSTPQGVTENNPIEYRAERSGYGPSNWSPWSTPVTIAKFLTIDGMEDDVEHIIDGIIADTSSTLGSALDRLSTLSSAFTSDGTFNGTISSGTKQTLLAGVVTSDTFTNELKKVSLAGLSISVDQDAPEITTFADWVNYETGQLKTTSQTLNTSLGLLAGRVTQLEGNDATVAIDKLKVDVHDKFASTERTIANSNYLTDASTGALMVNIPDYVTWFKSEDDMSSNKSGVEIDEKRSIEWVLCNDITNSNYTYAPFSTNLSTLYDNVTKKKPIVLQLNNVSYSNISSGFINTLTNNLRNNLTIAVSLSSDDTPISYSIESNETGYGIASKAADTGLSTTITTGVSASKVKCILYTDVTLDYSAINSKDENNKVVFSNLNWKVGIVKKSNNVSDTNITFAYTKTASIDDVPWFNTSMATDSSKYQDIFDNLTMNSIYGYTLKKSGNSVIPAETYGTLGITSPDGYDFKLLPADGVTVSDVVDYLKNNNTSVISTDSWISADNSIPYNTTSKEYYVACKYTSGTPTGQATYAVSLNDSGNSSYPNTVSFVSTDISNIVDDSVSVSISNPLTGPITSYSPYYFAWSTISISTSTVSFSIPHAAAVSTKRDILECVTLATDYKNSQVKLTFTNTSNTNDETIYYLIVPSKYTYTTLQSIGSDMSSYINKYGSSYLYISQHHKSYFDITSTDTSYYIEENHFLNNSNFGTDNLPYVGTSQVWRNTTSNPSTVIDFNKAYQSGSMYYFTVLIRRYTFLTTGGYTNAVTVDMTTEPANTMTWITSGKNRTIQYPFKSYLLDKIKVTIKDRSVSDTFEDSNRIATGSPTSYLSVLPSERPYLISSVTELATISQHISEGIASTEIIAKAGDSTAVFFEQAIDGGGSQIYMNANEIGIESDYFKLDNSGLSMKGNLYAQDEYGHITAGIIGENKTDSNDIKFFAGTSSNTESILFNDINSAPFRVYENGHVVANDIEINVENGKTILGDEGLQAIEEKHTTISVEENTWGDGYNDLPNGDYTGDVSINTVLNSYGLSITTNGILTNGSNQIDLSENKLYIKYFDRIANPDVNNSEKPMYKKDYLYGVPVLCMWYMGQEYVMSPGAWTTNTSPDASSIRWVKSKDVYIYSFAYYSNNSAWFYSSRTSGITLSSLISTAGHYYVFKDSNAYSAGVGGRTDKELYQIKVDLGNDSSKISNYKTWIITDNSLAPTTTLTDKSSLQTWINSNGVRAIKERIDEAYRGIASNSNTPITEDICSTYKGYVQSSVTLADNDEFSVYSYTSITDESIQNLYDKFKYFVGAAGDRFNTYPSSTNTNHWIYSSYNPYDCTIQWLYNALPFDDGVSTVTRTISLNCKYYPQYTLTNGLTESNISTVFCVCTFYVYGYYSNHPTFNYYTTNNYFNGTAQMNTFSGTLKFDFILTFNSAITKSLVKGKIESFLKNFDFTKLQSNHVDLSAEIIANGDYNDMHFTKSTFDPITT